MAAVAIEQAEAEVTKWLDYKKISEDDRVDQADDIQTLVKAISSGVLVMDADCNLIHKLKFPLDGEMPITELKYKPRIKVASVHSHLQGIKSSDGDGRLCAYVAALASQPKDVIKALDTEDYRVGRAIAIFFL